jgi:hypothetical protein
VEKCGLSKVFVTTLEEVNKNSKNLILYRLYIEDPKNINYKL